MITPNGESLEIS